MRRFAIAGVLVALWATSALASGTVQASGSGQTFLSATFGFNADSNLNGHLDYLSNDGAYHVLCSEIDSFSGTVGTITSGEFTATCSLMDGTTVYAKVLARDLGEPGTSDWFCIGVSYTSPDGPYFIHDMGLIQAGNIQVHFTN
jgi:hypothetical protein